MILKADFSLSTFQNQPGEGRLLVICGVVGVLLWRGMVLLQPSGLVVIPDAFLIPIALLGLLFLFCGTLVWWGRPSSWSRIFLAYGIGSGIHWGGTIGASAETLELSLFFVYLSFTALADAALLHLALIYPRGGKLSSTSLRALYAPVALALCLALSPGFLSRDLLLSLAGLLLLIVNLFSISAGFIFLYRLFTEKKAIRQAAGLPLIAASMVLATVLSLLAAGGLLPGHAEAWNLVWGFVPASLAMGIWSLAGKQPWEASARLS